MRNNIRKVVSTAMLLIVTISIVVAAPRINEASRHDTTFTLNVAGNCGMCKSRIEKAAKDAGASFASWDAATQLLKVTMCPTETTANTIKERIAGAGHDVDGIRADDNVYNELPGCCLYTRMAQEGATETPSSPSDNMVSFEVAGVCGMCKSRIEKAAEGTGLEKAYWDANTQLLTLAFLPGKFDVEKAKQRILAVGHDVEDRTADQVAYKNLPACCHYHDENNPHKIQGMEDHHHEDGHQEHTVTGVIMQEDNRGQLTPIESANIYWLEDDGVNTRSDASGVFKINHESGFKHLVVSYAGHQPDTLTIINPHEVVVVTAKNNVLAEVTVSARRSSNYIAALSPTRLEVLTGQELFKAACCDLSESFETNASVDVVSSDAVTGSKQIQMLGLSGIYTQLTVESLPAPRGLATPLGLNSIAGTWIESIQIGKGIGSVVNGFENIAGQINV